MPSANGHYFSSKGSTSGYLLLSSHLSQIFDTQSIDHARALEPITNRSAQFRVLQLQQFHRLYFSDTKTVTVMRNRGAEGTNPNMMHEHVTSRAGSFAMLDNRTHSGLEMSLYQPQTERIFGGKNGPNRRKADTANRG
jgi:hypothetical protein